MRERGWGRIVGITSISVKEPIDTLLLSNVFRSGVTSLFKSLSREVAADGVTRYDDVTAESSGLAFPQGWKLMEYFLGGT